MLKQQYNSTDFMEVSERIMLSAIGFTNINYNYVFRNFRWMHSGKYCIRTFCSNYARYSSRFKIETFQRTFV